VIGIKIFIAGPRSVSKLNLKVATKLDNIINNDFTVLVGDANGVDKAIQKYCNEKEYGNVIVYATGKHEGYRGIGKSNK
jgi:predicted Rossmann fold nucleotide-binding protein DprA/Smf involved in DNA uptake